MTACQGRAWRNWEDVAGMCQFGSFPMTTALDYARYVAWVQNGWPCSSPRRNQCRAGLTRWGYFTRANWRLQQYDAGRRGYAHTDWDTCHNPLAGVRASDWLKELDE